MPENPKPHKSNQLNFTTNNIHLVTLPGLVQTLVSARAWPALHQLISHCHDRDTDMQHCSTDRLQHFHLGHSTALSDAVILIVLIWSYGLSLRIAASLQSVWEALLPFAVSSADTRVHCRPGLKLLDCKIFCDVAFLVRSVPRLGDDV